jgi:hypothetical protein
LLPQTIADAQYALRSYAERLVAANFVSVLPLVERTGDTVAEQRPRRFMCLGIANVQRGERIKMLSEYRRERRKRRRRALRAQRAYAG